MPELDRGILVSIHACERYAQRGRLDELDVPKIAMEIEAQVEKAIKGGRVQNHKLPNYMLYKEKRKNLREPERFVYREDKKMAWIVKFEPGYYVVVTTLSPTWAEESAA